MKTISPSPVRALVLAAVVSAPLLTLSSGCIAVVAAAGAGATVAYTKGTMEDWLDAGFDPAVRAAHDALTQLGFTQVAEAADGEVTVVTARTATDQKVEIRLAHGGSNFTQVKIRVGWLGDQARSKEVLAKIKAGLPASGRA